MGFRLEYQGAVIQADTAADVRDFLVLMAQPLPRLLAAGPVVDIEADPPARPRRPRRRPAPRRERPSPSRRRAPRMGGGVDKQARPRPTATPAFEALTERVLGAVREGVSKPSDIVTRVSGTVFRVRAVLKALTAAGHIRAEGATLSRRYYPADRQARSAPKEGVR